MCQNLKIYLNPEFSPRFLRKQLPLFVREFTFQLTNMIDYCPSLTDSIVASIELQSKFENKEQYSLSEPMGQQTEFESI